MPAPRGMRGHQLLKIGGPTVITQLTTNFMYLRPPVGASPEELPTIPAEPTPPRIPDGAPPPNHIARLVALWLEALEGLRPVDNLRRAPFTDTVLEQLRSRRAHRQQARAERQVPHILSLHIQPSAGNKVRFCVSIRSGQRVRAIAGSLARSLEKQRVDLHQLPGAPLPRKLVWKIDSLNLI